MALGVGDFVPSASGVSSFLGVVLLGSLVIALIAIACIAIRNKIKYQYVAEVHRRRQDSLTDQTPQAKMIVGKAGYFNVKGRIVFRIKYGKMPWQQIELSKIPDPKFMIDNKVYYAQLQKDNYVQMKYHIDWSGKFDLEPVEDDLKYGAQLDFMEKERILRTETTWQKYGGPITMGLILVAGIVAMYFQTQACG